MGGAISAVFSAVASLFTSPLIAPITLLATQLFKPKMPPPPNPRATPESREAVCVGRGKCRELPQLRRVLLRLGL